VSTWATPIVLPSGQDDLLGLSCVITSPESFALSPLELDVDLCRIEAAP
jgi:hypothetical protein